MTTFDTETMAELFVKQGLVERALDIYRKLALGTDDPAVRMRYSERITTLAPLPPEAELTTPGLRVNANGAEVDIAWRLPDDVREPALQLLLVRRTTAGIETEPRTLPLASARGNTRLNVPELYAVRAAAGRIEAGAFIPIARAPAGPRVG